MTRDGLSGLMDVQILALCAWGEARGEPIQGQLGVMWVIRNRVHDQKRRYGRGYAEVILRPLQFSCMNADDPNLAKILAMADRLEEATGKQEQPISQLIFLGHGILMGDLSDVTGGANHYHATSISRPHWTGTLQAICVLGNHAFYRL